MAKVKDIFKDTLAKFDYNMQVREYADGHPSISTGSLALDVSVGIGGIPVGRYTELYGPESGGKTTLSLNICREAIKSGLEVLYVDPENKVDFSYAERILGEYYSPDKIIILQPKSAEDAFKITDAGISSNFGCIVFDSIAAISPEDELEEDDFGKLRVGLAPRLTNLFLRKTAYKIRDKEIAFIFTNQVRANIGSYNAGYTTPAGYALRHYSSLIIYLSKGKPIEEGDEQVGNYVNFIVKKNNVGIPFRQAETNIIYGKGVDYYLDVIKFSTMLGVVKTRGSYYVFGDETLGQGTVKAVELLQNNKEVLDKIVESCYNVSGTKYPPVRMEGHNKDELQT